jgi:ABC-2 type transport system ATP-binding protein
MATGHAIEAHQLAKRFHTRDGQTVVALRGLDLSVHAGEIYALLGPNGAGKTTALAILTTLLSPTSGWATVAGCDVVAHPAEVRRHIGVTFQEVVLDQELTGRQVLDFHGRLYGLSRAERQARIRELIALVELDEALDRHVAGYSGGMKRRLELARGLLTQPQVLFLDEPTQGLDPHNRAAIWRYIHQLRDRQGLTLLLTTHYMEEAEALADRVGIVDQGALVVEGAPAALMLKLGADVVEVWGTGDLTELLPRIQSEPYVVQVSHHPGGDCELSAGATPQVAPAYRLQIGVDDGDRRLVALLRVAADTGFHVQSVRVDRPSLADVFLTYTGHALRDG